MTFVCNFSRIGRKLKEIGWSGKDFSKFLFPTREEEKEEEEKTRVKVRFYRGSYGCMRVEPFDQFTLIHTVLRRVSFLKGARRNIQNGGIIFNVEKRLKKRRKNPSKQSIFRLKYNFPRYDVNASSYFAQSRCTKILTAWDNDWINLVRPSFLSKWIFWTVMPLRCDGIFSLFTIVATRSRKMRIASFIEVSPRRREGYSVSIFTRSPRQKRGGISYFRHVSVLTRAPWRPGQNGAIFYRVR